MRVAFVLSGLGAGGAERVVALLANNWATRGWTISILCFEPQGTCPYHHLHPDIAVIRRSPPAVRSPWRAAIDLVGRIMFLRRTFRREDPDVVISFLTKNNVLALLAGLGARRPLLLCERNNPLKQEVRKGWHSLQNLLAHRGLLILQTHASRRAFSSAVAADARVIPNPVAPLPFSVNTSARTIVGVGRLVEQKGFDLLLEAFATLAPAFPEWNLIIWGEGPKRGELEQRCAALNLTNRVAFPGLSIAPGGWVQSGSIFALSSRFEGFPNVLIEAMSAGMAVVSFDCPFGPSEIVSDAKDGFLAPGGDVPALAARLERLMRDEALRMRIADAGRRSVARFATDAVVAQWDAALQAAMMDGRANLQANAVAERV